MATAVQKAACDSREHRSPFYRSNSRVRCSPDCVGALTPVSERWHIRQPTMAFHIARIRKLVPEDGAASGPPKFPARVEVRVTLGPPELFGSPAPDKPRSLLSVAKPNGQVLMDANTGRFEFAQSGALPLMALEVDAGDQRFRFAGAECTATRDCENDQDVVNLLNTCELELPANISLATGLFVSVESILLHVGDRRFRYSIHGWHGRTPMLDAVTRQREVLHAMSLLALGGVENGRWILALQYFRQALRMQSPIEVRIPNAFVAETILNLAKAIELLFSSHRDRVRASMTTLGFAAEETERTIVPLFLFRNRIDVGHPSGRRIAQEDVEVVRHFCDFAVLNVGRVLLRAGRGIAEGTWKPEPLDGESEEDTTNLIERIREYAKQPGLPPDPVERAHDTIWLIK